MRNNHPPAAWTTYLRSHEKPPVRPAEFEQLMRHPRYPRASAYDPAWVRNNGMGPNPLWLVDDLTQHLELRAG